MSSDAQAIIEAALSAAEPGDLGDGRKTLVVPAGATAHIIAPIDEEFLDFPRRVRGEATVFDVDSLSVLWAKHQAESSELYADRESATLTAVLNADATPVVPGFRDHRVRLVCRQTSAWKAWTSIDGLLGTQESFAEFLEDRVVDVIEPSGAEMLELAQSFEATTKVDFKSAAILSSGQRALVYEETMAAKAGQTGQIEIPTFFTIGLRPFEGGETYRVKARLRYRVRDGRLAIGFKLERPEDVLAAAFADVVESAAQACSTTPIQGKPFPAVV